MIFSKTNYHISITLFSDAKPAPIPVLVTLHSIAKETEFLMATKDIHVGCVRTMAVSQKKVCNNWFAQANDFVKMVSHTKIGIPLFCNTILFCYYTSVHIAKHSNYCRQNLYLDLSQIIVVKYQRLHGNSIKMSKQNFGANF